MTVALRFGRHMAPTDRCPRCSRSREKYSPPSQRLRCASRVWDLLIPPTRILEFLNETGDDWLRKLLENNYDNIIIPELEWRPVCLAALWTIWRDQNAWLFKNNVFSLQETIYRSLALDIVTAFPSTKTISKVGVPIIRSCNPVNQDEIKSWSTNNKKWTGWRAFINFLKDIHA